MDRTLSVLLLGCVCMLSLRGAALADTSTVTTALTSEHPTTSESNDVGTSTDASTTTVTSPSATDVPTVSPFTDACDPNPCNNGTCTVSSEGNYTCACPVTCQCTVTGDNCEYIDFISDCDKYHTYFNNTAPLVAHPDDCTQHFEWSADCTLRVKGCDEGEVFDPTFWCGKTIPTCAIQPTTTTEKPTTTTTTEFVTTVIDDVTTLTTEVVNVTSGPENDVSTTATPDVCENNTCSSNQTCSAHGDSYICTCPVKCQCTQLGDNCQYMDLLNDCGAYNALYPQSRKLLAHPDDCTKNFYCTIDGDVKIDQCSDGQIFDPVDKCVSQKPSCADINHPFPVTTDLPLIASTEGSTGSPTGSDISTTATAVTSPAGDLWNITHMSPGFGPMAGGTKVTLHGQGFKQRNISKVSVSDTEVEIQEITGNMMTFITPEMEYNLITSVIIELVDSDDVVAPFTENNQFEYRLNPSIDTIYPGMGIISGGTLMYINGSSMNAVAKPVLKFYTTIDVDGTVSEETFSEMCSIVDESLLECLTPDMQSIDSLTSERRRRDLTGFEARFRRAASTEERNISVSAHMGLVLDGYARYSNLTEEGFDPPIISGDPTVEPWTSLTPYNPETQGTIEIKGEGLISGISVHDYTVTIGQGHCNISKLTDTSMTCIPPSELPDPIEDTEERRNSTYRLVVIALGRNLRHDVGNVTYVVTTGGSGDSNLALILGLLGAILVVGVVIGVGAYCGVRENRATGGSTTGSNVPYQRQPAHPPHFEEAPVDRRGSFNLADTDDPKRRSIPAVYSIFNTGGDYMQSMGRPPDVGSGKDSPVEDQLLATHSLSRDRYVVRTTQLDAGEDFPIY